MKIDDLLPLPFEDFMKACATRHFLLVNSSPLHQYIADLGGYDGQQLARILWMRDWYEARCNHLEENAQ